MCVLVCEGVSPVGGMLCVCCMFPVGDGLLCVCVCAVCEDVSPIGDGVLCVCCR